VPHSSVDYFNKNSEHNISIVKQLLSSAYLILSLNKTLRIYYLVFALSGLESENDVPRVKRGEGDGQHSYL